jgi:Flp pilus assembly protein TadD
MSTQLEEFKEDFALLIEAGFIAVKQMDEKGAKQIFKAASELNPKSVNPQIGLGYIALNKLDLKEADKCFEQVIAKEPENWLAVCFLGISYMLQKNKRKKGEELVQKALSSSSDETIKNLAQISLQWSEKDLKKKDTKAPFFDKKEKSS